MALKITKTNATARKVDNMIRNLNRRVEGIIAISGSKSPVLESVEEVLYNFRVPDSVQGMIKGDVHEFRGISRSADVIRKIAAEPRYVKALEKALAQATSPAKIKENLVRLYDEEKGVKSKTKQEKEHAYTHMRDRLMTVKKELDENIQLLYLLMKDKTMREEAVEIQRDLSRFMTQAKGYHASLKDLEAANNMLKSRIAKARRNARKQNRRIGD